MLLAASRLVHVLAPTGADVVVGARVVVGTDVVPPVGEDAIAATGKLIAVRPTPPDSARRRDKRLVG